MGPSGKDLASRDFLRNDGRRLESIAILAGQLCTSIAKRLQPVGVDELNQTTRPRWRTDPHDRSNIAIGYRAQHTGFETL